VTGKDALLALIQALNATAVPYMVVGSFSSNFYGIPSSTKDADIVLDPGATSLAKMIRELGPDFVFNPQLLFETATATKPQIMDIRGTEFKIELFRLSNDPFDRERFRRRQPVSFSGFETFMPTAEDVIVMKFRWIGQLNRNKDRDDVSNVMLVQAGRIDWDYVNKWCDIHGTRELLDQIRATLPDNSSS
jgi:hypothetical protein